jgi:hypothetical protein
MPREEPKSARFGVAGAFLIVFLLAFLIAGIWYFFAGRQAKQTPSVPQSFLKLALPLRLEAI